MYTVSMMDLFWLVVVSQLSGAFLFVAVAKPSATRFLLAGLSVLTVCIQIVEISVGG